MTSSVFRALIVDDERLARRRLAKLLGAHPEVAVVGEAEDVDGAARALADDPSIDLVFLDIQMPGGSGFELFARTPVRAAVVFVTAYDAHALRAFEVNALDYLLKPVVPAHLARALSRLDPRPPSPLAGRVPSLEVTDRVRLQVGEVTRFVAVAEISCVRSAGDYSEVYLRGGGEELVRVSMREWEQRLAKASFLRVHRTALVNLDALVSLRPAAGSTHELVVTGMREPVPVSRKRLRELRARLAE